MSNQSEPEGPTALPSTSSRWNTLSLLLVVLSAAIGLGLLASSLGKSSATYDEVTYLRIAADWWRTGEQTSITRMGSPLTFWKIQQAPTLWLLDRLSYGHWIDDPIPYQSKLLPVARAGVLWIWLVALVLTAIWSRLLYGPRAMALAAILFALSPNLLAHGSLLTMEMPLVAATTGVFLLFWLFLRTGKAWPFWASAAVTGLAFSCKFTTIVLPPILGAAWWISRVLCPSQAILSNNFLSLPGKPKTSTRNLASEAKELPARPCRRTMAKTIPVGFGMLAFLSVMFLSNLIVTGGATLPLSPRSGSHPSLEGRLGPPLDSWAIRLIETPMPQDWVGFLTQMKHQQSGGSSYLLGERRMQGWWYYYLVALAVKVPLTFWILAMGRGMLGRQVRSAGQGGLIPLVIGLFLVITAIGSSRNYGVRYLLPLAPLAIVWVSALAEGPRWARRLAVLGVVGQAIAVAAIHPFELSYFNALAGGPVGGRRILADSNLDWGQGAKTLARLQRDRPEFQDLTCYYFGSTDPAHYGVVGRRIIINAHDDHPGLPDQLEAQTTYLAVSSSLQHGPWGPKDYFRELDALKSVLILEDGTIAIYRSIELEAIRAAVRNQAQIPRPDGRP